MKQSEASNIYRSMKAERDQVRLDRADLARREAALNKLLDGLLELFPSVDGTNFDAVITDSLGITSNLQVKSSSPRGKEAILRILSENPETWFSVHDIVARQRERGWAPSTDKPEEAVRTTIFRLLNSKRVVRKKVGRHYVYRFKDSSAPASEAEALEPSPNQGAAL